MSSSAMPSPTSNPRIVVATHNAAGASIFGADRAVPLFHPRGPAVSSFAVFDTRARVPVDNLQPAAELANAIPRCPPGGTVFCITNIPPRFTVPMHRTLSLDYAIVLSGAIVLVLEGGAEKTVSAGEFIVQAGTNHSWINRGEEACRIAVVSVGAEKIKLADGSELEEIVPVIPNLKK